MIYLIDPFEISFPGTFHVREITIDQAREVNIERALVKSLSTANFLSSLLVREIHPNESNIELIPGDIVLTPKNSGDNWLLVTIARDCDT